MRTSEHPWQVTASRHSTVACVLRLVGGSLLLLGFLSAVPASAESLSQEVSAVTNQLKQAWLSDPVSRSLPFPGTQILEDPASFQTACPDRAHLQQATGRVVYCPSRGTILIASSAFEADSDSRTWPLRYWVAIGLAEAITARTGAPSTSPVVASLENHCVAGILLAASKLTAHQSAEAILAPALLAYPLSKVAVVGTHAQRGYALLTGLGATELSCSAIDMQALSQNRVPDPDVLKSINLPRASSSLMAVLNSQCRPRPRAACPRRLNPATPSP